MPMGIHTNDNQKSNQQQAAQAFSAPTEEQHLAFEDNRPEAALQRKLKEMTLNSPQAQKADRFHQMANSHQNKSTITQRKMAAPSAIAFQFKRPSSSFSSKVMQQQKVIQRVSPIEDMVSALMTNNPNHGNIDTIYTGHTADIQPYLNQSLNHAVFNGRGGVIDRTLLGIAASWNENMTAINYLTGKGANINYQDAANGRAPLHRAAYKGHVPTITAMVGAGADVNQADATGWTPYDVAVASGQKPAQTALAGFVTAGGGADPRALQLPNAGGPNTVPEILAAATKSMNPALGPPQILALYQELYNYSDFRPILEIAALEASPSRAVDDNALRISISDNDSTLPLRSAYPHGSYNDVTTEAGVKQEGTVTLGGDRAASANASSGRVFIGTLIHELTHHAANKVFGNNAVPVPNNDVTALELYLAAYHTDSKRFLDNAIAPATSEARTIGFEQIEGGYNKVYLKLQEIIVRAPQTLAMFGRIAEDALPAQVNYYRNVFLPRARAFIGTHAQAGNLTPGAAPTGNLNARGAQEQVQLSTLSAAQIISGVEASYKGRGSTGGYASTVDQRIALGSDAEVNLSGMNTPATRGNTRNLAQQEQTIDPKNAAELQKVVNDLWGKKLTGGTLAGKTVSVSGFDLFLRSLATTLDMPKKGMKNAIRGVINAFTA